MCVCALLYFLIVGSGTPKLFVSKEDVCRACVGDGACTLTVLRTFLIKSTVQDNSKWRMS